MDTIDELMAAMSDLAGTVQQQAVRITAMDGELASTIRQLADIRGRLLLIEKNWE